MTQAHDHPIAVATQTIAAHLSKALTIPRDGEAQGSLIRVEAPLPGLSPLAWLRGQRECTHYYWSGRSGDFEMAGVGEADVLVPLGETDLRGLFAHMRAQLSPRRPSLRYYGGFRFHRGTVKGERWRTFKEYRFVVPRFEVLRRPKGVFLACNAKVGHPRTNAQTLESVLAELAALRFPDAPAPIALPQVLAREDRPDREGWNDRTRKVLEAIDRKQLKKLVLARETCFTAAEPFDPVALLSQLLRHTVRAFEFCFHPAPDRAFIGASPERLFRRTNCYIESEAVAGTRPRGKTDETDRALARELWTCEKAVREHRVVVEALSETFKHFCRHVDVEDEPSVLRLRNCQHLRTRIQGILVSNDIDADLLTALHPTPAVGGYPRDPALEWIAQEEPFDRGLYAAPVGWVGYDAAEFCVAIRSGLVCDNELTLYSGAGIVAGSDPAEEWAELEAKMQDFVNALGIHAR